MMKTIFFRTGIIYLLAAVCFPQTSSAQTDFAHNEQLVEIAREPARTRTVPYNSEEAAIAGIESGSPYFQALDGQWKRSGSTDGNSRTYTTTFKVPFLWVDRQYFLYIENIDGAYEVRVNGEPAGYNQSASTPSEFDLTRYCNEGINELKITVYNDPGCGISYGNGSMNIEGELYIIAQPKVRIRDFRASTRFIGADASVELGVIVKSHLLNVKSVRIHYDILSPDGNSVAKGYRDAEFNMRREDTVRFLVNIPRVERWSHETPAVYTLLLRTQRDGRYTEYLSYDIGFRTVEVQNNTFTINGFAPVLSVAEYSVARKSRPEREADLTRLKSEGNNTIILTGGPQPHDFYSLCSRLGLYVCNGADITTTGHSNSLTVGGTPSNNPNWENSYIDRITGMYYCSRNHPSVVMFSPAGPAFNGYNLYEGYLALKSLESDCPVVYLPAGGEWNTDAVSPAVAAANPESVAGRFIFDIAKNNELLRYTTEPEIAPGAPGWGKATITNRSAVTPIYGDLQYTLRQGSKKVSEGSLSLELMPGQTKVIELPTGTAKPNKPLKYSLIIN